MKYIKTYEESTDKLSIEELSLSCKNLTELSDLSQYTNLERLYCDGNQLTSLPELPDTIQKLLCYKNKLTSLPELPDMLTHLSCYKNELTSLPELPDTLIHLYCDDNQLTSIPELPKTLYNLDCTNNKLTSLPELPNKLKILYCADNQLPFDDLDGYKKWYEENKHIIDKEGLEYAYQLSKEINDYNL